MNSVSHLREATAPGAGRVVLMLSAMLLTVLASGPRALAAPKSDAKPSVRYEKAVEVPARQAEELSVVNRLGSVRIVGWDRAAVQVRAIKQAPTTQLGERLRVHVASPRGRRIAVRTYVRLRPALPPTLAKQVRALMLRHVRGAAGDKRAERRTIAAVRAALAKNQERGFAPEDYSLPLRDARVDLRIYVPRKLAVRARTFKHDIVVSGCRAGTEATTEEGKILVRDVRGKVSSYAQRGAQRIQRVSGNVFVGGGSDVTLEKIQGDVRASSFAGSIDARDVGARAVDLRTIGGDIALGWGVRRGRARVVTLSGTLSLLLPRKPRLRIQGRAARWHLGPYTAKARTKIDTSDGKGRLRGQTRTVVLGVGTAQVFVVAPEGAVRLQRRPKAKR